jgi:hypothetical protein
MKCIRATAPMGGRRCHSVLFGGLLICFLAAGWVRATGRNIAPDAVTRATTGYNEYEGELAYLTDGEYPGNAPEPGAFTWPNKGNLIFQFDRPLRIDGLRLYVGDDAGAYQVMAYSGAEYSVEGQTVLDGAVVLTDAHNFDFRKNNWTELLFAEAVETDYLELATESGAVFHEIEILSSADAVSAVRGTSWGRAKAPANRHHGSDRVTR